MSEVRRMPVLFVGHGSPMNAILDNEWSRAFRDLGRRLPAPKAILCVSAHWYVPGTFVTGNARPKTIHDFGGFPDELYQVEYPAPGDGVLAERIVALVGRERVSVREDWGLDHGTWSVLVHTHPEARCPVVQLAIDQRLAPAAHVEIGRALAPLRDEGVLVLGSGNVTHNLRDAFNRYGRGDRATPLWALEFDRDVEKACLDHDAAFLSRAVTTDVGRVAHPTLDHYVPLLYACGASDSTDRVSFPIGGFDMGSLSMRAVLFD